MTRADPPSGDLTLPSGVVAVLDEVGDSQRHPGLQLDKLSPPGDQKAQKAAIERVRNSAGDPRLLALVSERRDAMLQHVGAARFRATTEGPLTLHLARASGLENAGIHLHPVYGFACLPGSGLKGSARAYAETVWLADQSDPATAWNDIRAVFGWAPRSEEGKRWKPENADDPEGASAGSVVFHDAWPVRWPRLVSDVVNNHHRHYYEGEDDPGDWDDPVPAYFLSVAAGATFDFALSPRTTDSGDGSRAVVLAREWLQAALVHEGAGAKTNAGYGRFRLVDHPNPKVPKAARCMSGHTLELVTPAFLAGAQQQKEDCDLRPATLRGLLRWWWRTMHAAHLSREDLRRLETAVWGDAETGAALALSIRGEHAPQIELFDYKDGFKPKPEFVRTHNLQRPEDKKTTQGLFYASYGMDDGPKHEKRKRYYIEPGAQWKVILSARQTVMPNGGGIIPASDVLRQGETALWLLCRYSGVGSKARKGFGSFRDVDIAGIANVEDCKQRGTDFRSTAGFAVRPQHQARSSSLDEIYMLSPEVETPWRDWWFAIDQLGFAVQSFAQKNAHQDRKAALGLPRKIHGPRNDPMPHQARESHRPPRNLPVSVNGRSRYASPVHYHLAPRADGALTVRMTAFPAPDLPDINTSREVLKELREHLKSELAARAQKHANRGTKPPERRVSPAPADKQEHTAGLLPKPGDPVEAVLLEERTRKDGWKARHEPSGLQGPIQNSVQVSATAEPGDRVRLIVALVRPGEMAFSWPTPETEARRSRSGGRRRQRGSGSKHPPRTRR